MRDSLFSHATRAGTYRLAAADALALAATAKHQHFALLSANLAGEKTLADVLGELGKAFRFPEWYGRNLDALHDCLTDPDWQGPAHHKGVIVVLAGLDTLRAKHPGDFANLVEVLQSACEIWRNDGFPFWVLVEASGGDLPLLPDA